MANRLVQAVFVLAAFNIISWLRWFCFNHSHIHDNPPVYYMNSSSFEAMSKLAAQVENHSEFLTWIRHNVSQRTQVARGSFKTLQEYLRDRRCSLNTEGLLQLMIQLAYFLYACKVYQAVPTIDINSDLRVEETAMRGTEKRFSVFIWYKIEEGKMKEGMGMRLFVGIVREIQKRLEDYLARRMFKREGSQQEFQQDRLLKLFYRQLQNLADNSYFEQHESLFFLCLEQTTVFYETSMMYLIKNCSIMDFIKTHEGKLSQFRIAKVRDESLVVEYKKEQGKGLLQDEQSLTAKQREIQANITQFFKAISDKQYFELPSKNQKDQTYRVKFNYTLREREKYDFEEMVQSMQDANVFHNDSKRLMHCCRTPSEVEYLIEYSSEKNQICVRLYNTFLPSFEVLDFQIFQSNVFIYESLNVSIELSQPKIRGIDRSNKKVITFKGTASFNQKEPPLERILLLIDVTMIASKIYQPQLKARPGVNHAKDYQRLSTISKKINHYTKLFLKCAKKIYSE